MSKYIIDVGDAYIRHGLERTLAIHVRINDHEDHWMDTRIPVTPYTESDMEKVREEAFKNGYDAACKDIDIKSKTNAAYQKGYQDATVKISSDEQAIAEKAYQKGLNDAWSFAEHLAYISDDVTNSVYMSMNGGKGLLVAFGMSYEDAKKQYDEYFKKKKEEQIQVGDEVIAKFSGIKYVIVKVEGSRLIGFSIEWTTCDIDAQFVEKTGRHFHEIATALAKMKEES